MPQPRGLGGQALQCRQVAARFWASADADSSLLGEQGEVDEAPSRCLGLMYDNKRHSKRVRECWHDCTCCVLRRSWVDPRSFGAKNFDPAASFKICNAVELDVQKGWGHAFACGWLHRLRG